MTDKRRPSFSLMDFKRAAVVEDLLITRTALTGAAALGFDMDDIKATIRTMQPRHFYKSTTSIHDHRQWQDVYHVPAAETVVYIKFT